MVQKGGLGRGLMSLIPQTKSTSQAKNRTSRSKNKTGRSNRRKNLIGVGNHFGAEAVYEKKDSVFATTGFSSRAGRGKNKAAPAEVIEAPTDKITPNPHQPRKHFSKEKLNELANSIAQYGVLQPLIVSQTKDGDRYELIAGERRLEASKIAGKQKVPVIVKEAKDQEKLELSLIENVQRHDLNPIEEARGYKKMQDLFGLTQEKVAEKSGKSRSSVANVLRLLKLPIEIQQALIEEKVSEGHARSILMVNNPEKQRALFGMILKENWTVRQVENQVRKIVVGKHVRRIKKADLAIQQKENELAESLGTKVKIKRNNKGGRIIVEFYSEEELGALVTRLKS